MTPTQLQNIIEQGKSETVEFKTTFNNEALITINAFANTKGGTLLIGVADNGEIKGVNINKESIPNWLNEVKTKTEPSIIPDIDTIISNHKTVVVIKVHEHPIKPLAFRGRYYKRLKKSNHQLSVAEISDCYLKSTQTSWDAFPASNKSFNDLDEEKIIKFIARVNKTGRFHLSNKPSDALIKLRMLQGNQPTNAAMILFSKENLMYNLHIGRFKSPSVIISDKLINGNLFDVLDEAMQEIISHVKFAFEITGESTQRNEIPEYPLEALRELLLNSIVHRDYQNPSDIQIRIFDNHIAFYNPGGLFGNISIEDLKTDHYNASTRNKQIAEALYLTKDIEKYGSGFIRIRKAIKEYPTMEFQFSSTQQGFTAGFNYATQKTHIKKTVGKTVGKIIEAINNEPGITIPELMVKTDLSRRGVEYQLNKLKNENIIKRIGSAKGGHWEVIEH
jgi:ATP-dependent DNA helicase RecG